MRDHKNKNVYRISSYVLVVFSVYFFISSLFTHSVSDANLNLLEQKYQLVYGQQLEGEPLKIEMNDTGEIAVFFQVSPFPSKDFSRLQFQILDLPLNYQVNLVWTIKDQAEIQEFKLPQTNGNIQSLPLNQHPGWRGIIQQLGIRILPQDHLGLSHKSNAPITIKQLKFAQTDLFSAASLLWNHWWDYDSWSYKSINHLRHQAHWPWHSHPIVFVIICLTLLMIIDRWVFTNKPVNLTPVLIAWLFLNSLFLSDLIKNGLWVHQEHKTNQPRHPDLELSQLSVQVKALLGLSQPENISEIKNRVFILSSDRYQRSRLIYHMLPVNSSFIDIRLQSSMKNQLSSGDFILSYNAAMNPLRPVSGVLRLQDHRISVKEMARGETYSLMEVIEP